MTIYINGKDPSTITGLNNRAKQSPVHEQWITFDKIKIHVLGRFTVWSAISYVYCEQLSLLNLVYFMDHGKCWHNCITSIDNMPIFSIINFLFKSIVPHFRLFILYLNIVFVGVKFFPNSIQLHYLLFFNSMSPICFICRQKKISNI